MAQTERSAGWALDVDDRAFSASGNSMCTATRDVEVSFDVNGVSADDPDTSWEHFHRSGVVCWPSLQWHRFPDRGGLGIRVPTDRCFSWHKANRRNIMVTCALSRTYRSCGDPHPKVLSRTCGMPCSNSVGHQEPVWVMVCLIGLSKISPLHRFRMQCQLQRLKYITDCTGRFAADELLVHVCTVT